MLHNRVFVPWISSHWHLLLQLRPPLLELYQLIPFLKRRDFFVHSVQEVTRGRGGRCHVDRRGRRLLDVQVGWGRGLVEVDETLAKYCFQAETFAASAQSTDDQEEKEDGSEREPDVQVIHKRHVHPIDCVAHLSSGGRFSFAHPVLPLGKDPLQLAGLLKGCPRTAGPLVRWRGGGQLLGCSESEPLPGWLDCAV